MVAPDRPVDEEIDLISGAISDPAFCIDTRPGREIRDWSPAICQALTPQSTP